MGTTRLQRRIFGGIQKARAKGVELGIRTFLSEEFSVGATYTYLDAKVIDAGLRDCEFVRGVKRHGAAVGGVGAGDARRGEERGKGLLGAAQAGCDQSSVEVV